MTWVFRRFDISCNVISNVKFSGIFLRKREKERKDSIYRFKINEVIEIYGDQFISQRGNSEYSGITFHKYGLE